jgi:predicted nucleotide-binding protein
MTAVSANDPRTERDSVADPPNHRRSRTVFVVHGRNDAARRAIYVFLRSIGLAPIEWSQALAMTGQASPYIGNVLDVALNAAQAVIVLLTPDEVAALRTEYANGEDDPEVTPGAQSRPNVLFEAGLALGRAPDRTVVAELGKVRPFSDIAGRHVVRLSNSVASRQELATRLQTAGCSVDLTGTDWHSAGDFSAPPPLTMRSILSQPARRSRSWDTVPPRAGERPAQPIILANITVKEARGRAEIHGEATNNDVSEHGVRLKATFYDAERKIIGGGHGYVSQLAPGQTKAFSFKSDDGMTMQATVDVQIDHVY